MLSWEILEHIINTKKVLAFKRFYGLRMSFCSTHQSKITGYNYYDDYEVCDIQSLRNHANYVIICMNSRVVYP